MPQPTDAQLLAAFTRGQTDAFHTLAARYTPLIYAAAKRQAPPHLAEDITQAVFLLLAKRAHTLRSPELLPAWLLKVTRFCAADARRAAQRRQKHEQKAAAMAPTLSHPQTQTSSDADELAPHLDAALASLPTTDRTALLLRYYHDHSLPEIAAALHLSEEAAKKRLTRALEKLRKLFARKKITLAAPILATLLAKNALATPPALAATCATAALTPTTASPAAALLAKSTAKLITWSTAKLAVTATAGVLLLTTATATLLHQKTIPIAAPPPTPAASGGAGLVAHPIIQSSPSIRILPHDPIPTIEVLDLATNAPIPGAQIMISNGDTRSPFLATATTGPDGKLSLPYPPTIANNIHIIATKPGYVPVETATTRRFPTDPAPDHFTLRLEHATTIGGRILDSAGNPLQNASVHVAVLKNYDPDTFVPWDHEFTDTTTNANGEWSLSNVPATAREIVIDPAHPASFPPDGIGTPSPVFAEPLLTQLRKKTFTVQLPPALQVTGTVHAPDGQPIKATISIADERFPSPTPEISTDDHGRFQLCLPKNTNVTARAHAEGFATTPFLITVEDQPSQTDITLQPAQPLAAQILDPAGAPIPNATATIEYAQTEPKSHRYKCLVRYLFSDANGNIAWHDAVPQPFSAKILAPGFMQQLTTLNPGSPKKITLFPQPLLHVHAIAATTGNPITDFRIIPGFIDNPRSHNLQWPDYPEATQKNARQLPDGSFELTTPIQYLQFALRATGPHYAAIDSAPIPLDGHDYDITFPLEEAPPFTSQLMDADGQPLPHTPVFLTTTWLDIYNADYPFSAETIKRDPPHYAITDNDGTFTFPPQKDHFLLVVATDKGYAFSTDKQLAKSGALLLHPWATINGTLLINNIPAPNIPIHTDCIPLPDLTFGPGIQHDTRTDNNGHFSIPHAPGGDYILTAQSLPTPLEKRFHLRPGQSLTLNLHPSN